MAFYQDDQTTVIMDYTTIVHFLEFQTFFSFFLSLRPLLGGAVSDDTFLLMINALAIQHNYTGVKNDGNTSCNCHFKHLK